MEPYNPDAGFWNALRSKGRHQLFPMKKKRTICLSLKCCPIGLQIVPHERESKYSPPPPKFVFSLFFQTSVLLFGWLRCEYLLLGPIPAASTTECSHPQSHSSQGGWNTAVMETGASQSTETGSSLLYTNCTPNLVMVYISNFIWKIHSICHALCPQFLKNKNNTRYKGRAFQLF